VRSRHTRDHVLRLDLDGELGRTLCPMRGLVLVLLAAIGCRSTRVDDGPARPAVSAPRDAAPVDAPRAPAPQRQRGHLAPNADQTAVYPTRVCVDGNELVFENSCGCNDALLCTLDRAENATLHFTLRTDPTRTRTCDDCFAMVPARCGVPPLQDHPAGATWTIVINRQTAFELPLDARGMPIDGSCWTQAP
jgi:hypothetical protein